MKTPKTSSVSLVCLLLLAPAVLHAQGAYLDKGTNGFGALLRAEWGPNSFAGLGLMSGYTIAGILDFGLDLNLARGQIGGRDAADFRIAFAYNLNVLKQSEGLPVSLQLQGSYGVVNALSQYLQDQGAQRRGRGLTVGVVLSRDIRIGSFAQLRLSALADYESMAYTTTWSGGDPPDSTDYHQEAYLGGGLGVNFRLPRGAVVSVQGELRADEDFELRIRPVVAIAVPTS